MLSCDAQIFIIPIKHNWKRPKLNHKLVEQQRNNAHGSEGFVSKKAYHCITQANRLQSVRDILHKVIKFYQKGYHWFPKMGTNNIKITILTPRLSLLLNNDKSPIKPHPFYLTFNRQNHSTTVATFMTPVQVSVKFQWNVRPKCHLL